jgi:NHL repeat
VQGKPSRDPLTNAATAAPAPRARPGRTFASALVLAGLVLACLAGSASAITLGHIYSHTIGAGHGAGNGQVGEGFYSPGVAIDESGGVLFVADRENHRVLKFDTSGEFLQAWGYGVSDGTNTLQVCSAPSPCQAGIAGAATGQFEVPISIAVDNSGGPNDGDVYVANGPTGFGSPENSVLRFSSSGAFERKISDSSIPGNWDGFGRSGPIAVDGQGFLWVAATDDSGAAGGREAGIVAKFSNQSSNDYVGGSQWTCACGYIEAIAVNVAGTHVFVTGPGGLVAQYEADGTAPSTPFGLGGLLDHLAVDPGNEHLYIASGNAVHEYGTDHAEIVDAAFGEGQINGAGSLAVDSTTGNIYVADGSSGTILVFAPSVLPDVTTEPASGVGHTDATLNGEVAPDPLGGGDVSSCKFQYMEKEAFDLYTGFGFPADLVLEFLATQVPCSPTAPYSSQAAVSAEASGLTMETAYIFRVVAENSNGARSGAVLNFTPRAVIGISSDPATDVTQTTATLNGSFDPNGEDTHYYFEWGTDTTYGNVSAEAPGEDAGSTAGDTPVSFGLEGLTAFTTYHYRIVAGNSLGTSLGPDRTFRTEAPLLPGVSPTAVSDVGLTDATLSAEITPGFGATVYVFEYGTTPAYGFATDVSDSIGSDNDPHPVAADLTDLAPGTKYYARAVAINFGGTTHGAPTTFVTPNATTGGSGSGEVVLPPAPPPTPPIVQKPPACDAGKLAHGARRAAQRAKQLHRRARKLDKRGGRASHRQAKRLKRRAHKSARTAKRMSDAAKSCRRNLRRAK